jgi:hypothetical protein
MASPWAPYVAENLNDYVKHRESFRPFGVAVSGMGVTAKGTRFLVSTKNLRSLPKKMSKVVPENWREDVKIRLFLDNLGSESARVPLAKSLGFRGSIDGIAVKTQQLRRAGSTRTDRTASL